MTREGDRTLAPQADERAPPMHRLSGPTSCIELGVMLASLSRACRWSELTAGPCAAHQRRTLVALRRQ